MLICYLYFDFEKISFVTFSASFSYPRLNRESLLPIAKCAGQESHDSGTKTSKDMNYNPEEWYPPGHGDFYRSFVACGLAEKMIAIGKQWVFLSNIDNLGATVDLSILS